MKIGILSYPLNNNYGCYLQAFALKSVLENWGHYVTYIHRRHTISFSFMYKVKFFIKNLLKIIIHFKKYPLFFNAHVYEDQYMMKQGKYMYPFFEKYINPHTEPLYSTKELKACCEGKFDVIVVGSDQVWRADLLKNIEDYYLVFLEDKDTKRIAYAASFGNCSKYPNRKMNICGEGYATFDATSVREDDGVTLIKNWGWKGPTPCHVLDPTLLLDRYQYNKLLPKQKQKDMLFCYILDTSERKERYMQMVSKYLDLKMLNILGNRERDGFVFPSIETWLQGIRDSKYVVTDSFHGTVFSIIFNVPFSVIPNQKRGLSRFLSLLHMFGLEDRIVKENDLSIVETPIDWNAVNQKLEERKAFSIEFLQKALNK